MNLIHGILSLKSNLEDNTLIRTMAQATRRFAPDGIGYWQQGNIALAANLLKTLPVGRHEPRPVVTDVNARLCIVADARIDNRSELCRELEIENTQSKTISDTGLILEAYKKWRDDCPVKLIGDFVFAIWDELNQFLFCCRDVFSQRPFYYHISKDWFIFSSDLAALFSLDMIPKTLDEGYIADQIGGLHLYTNNTPYVEIDCLGDAHCLTINKNGQVRSKRYWQPDLAREIHYDRDEQYVEHYLNLFTEAVKCRLASDDPVGSFISGGLDSSSISVVAAQILHSQGKQLASFCHVLPAAESNPEGDEKALVQLLEKQNGLTVTWVSQDLFDETQLMQREKDILSGGNRFVLTSLGQASERGCKVFLCGFGGDQGATYFAQDLVAWQIRSGDFSGFYRQAKALSKDTNNSILRTILNLLWRFGRFQSNVTPDKQIHKHLFDTCVYNSDFANRIDVMTMARSAHRFSCGNPGSFRESIWKKLTEGVNPHNKSAATFTRSHMEARFPMFDRRLVEFCLAVPPEQHRSGKQGRYLIRRAMKQFLPDEVRLRHDKRYSANPGKHKNIADNLQKHQEILKKAFGNPQIEQYIDLNRIQKRLNQLQDQIARGRQKEFRAAATLRVLRLIEFMVNH